MKRILALLICTTLLFTACGEDLDDNLVAKTEANTSFKFTHNWDGEEVTNSTSNSTYTNENGEELSIVLLRYLISDITFSREGEEDIVLNVYNLVDVTSNNNLIFSPETKIPTGTYTNVSFTFGFKAEDNIDGAYPDLADWVVPNIPMFGSIGGYHYMQLEGKYSNSTTTEANYAYHTIRAADGSTTPPTIQETAINVNLGPAIIFDDINFEIKMNIAEWFKTPYQWDLSQWNTSLMGNFQAQLKMNENGQNVFSLGTITQ